MRLFVEARFAPCSETEFLAVRHGVEVVEADGNWRESFAADAWLAAGQGARVQLGHDGLDVGAVVCVVQRDGWHVADFVVEAGDPDVLRHVHVGRAVSIDARSVRRDDDDFVRIRRHRLAQLKAIAILNPGQHPGYEGAEITRIREVAQATTVEGEVLTGDGVLSRDCGVVLGVR
jgi:hypothetical protein